MKKLDLEADYVWNYPLPRFVSFHVSDDHSNVWHAWDNEGRLWQGVITLDNHFPRVTWMMVALPDEFFVGARTQ